MVANLDINVHTYSVCTAIRTANLGTALPFVWDINRRKRHAEDD